MNTRARRDRIEFVHRTGSTETFLTRLAAMDLSPSLNDTLVPLRRLIEILDDELATADTRLHALVATDVTVRRLTTVPGIGPITASAFVAALETHCTRRCRCW